MKLKYYIRELSKDQREDFASKSGTSVGYLYLLAGAHRSPSMSMARRLQEASKGKVTLNDWSENDTQTTQ